MAETFHENEATYFRSLMNGRNVFPYIKITIQQLCHSFDDYVNIDFHNIFRCAINSYRNS